MKIAPRSRWCDAQLPGSAEEPCRATWAAQAGSRPDEELLSGVHACFPPLAHAVIFWFPLRAYFYFGEASSHYIKGQLGSAPLWIKEQVQNYGRACA